MVAGGAVALRKPAGLWPHAGQLRRHCLRRPWLQLHAIPSRRPARNRAGDAGRTSVGHFLAPSRSRRRLRADRFCARRWPHQVIEGPEETATQLDGGSRDGRHYMRIRVYYEDTDFSGIVYHANYLRFMERGRTNHLRLMGAEQHALFAEAQAETPGFAFVVRSMQIDYLKPARMDDVLDVVTWPVAVKGASITLAPGVRRGEA